MLRVLHNPVYAGFMRCGDELHESEHEPLVSREQFARVGGVPPDVVAAVLDDDLRYYRCVTRDKHGRRACEARPLPAAAIEGFVIAKIRAVTAGGNLAQDVARSLEERSQRQRKSLFAERRALASKIARISSEGISMAERFAMPQNRARLVRTLVQRVDVDERAGTVTAVLVDIGADHESAEPAAAPVAYDHASP